MANEAIVIMAANEHNGTMPLYLEQLRKGGVDYHVYPVDCDMSRGGLLKDKIAGIRKSVDQFGEYQHLIISDCCDITFYGDLDKIKARAVHAGDKVVWAAEKNCYPDASLASQIHTLQPYAYANGGLSIGSPAAYSAWCDEVSEVVKDHNVIDQYALNLMLSQRKLFVDDRTHLFLCLYGGYENLEFVNGEPVNTLCDTWPLWIHANGCWTADEMFEKYNRSLA